MTRPELDIAIDWAAAEGWNPGINDADAFWRADPHGFLGGSVEGEVVATGSAVSYGPALTFLGLFIVPPEKRGKGYGRTMWAGMEAAAEGRLGAGGVIGLDGVLAVVDFYASHGFRRIHDHVRMGGPAGSRPAAVDTTAGVLVPAAEVPFEGLVAFDAEHFGTPRPAFLRAWIEQPTSTALVLLAVDELAGFAVRRRCRTGHKIGPLFALTPAGAEVLLAALRADVAAGDALFLDVPDQNPAAVQLARGAGMTEVFRCARMYRGAAPAVPWSQVFGATTLELG